MTNTTKKKVGLGPRALGPGEGGDLIGRLADFTIGTAVVLWHAALANRELRRRPDRTWSSTR